MNGKQFFPWQQHHGHDHEIAKKVAEFSERAPFSKS
jgi:hypothetical protein